MWQQGGCFAIVIQELLADTWAASQCLLTWCHFVCLFISWSVVVPSVSFLWHLYFGNYSGV